MPWIILLFWFSFCVSYASETFVILLVEARGLDYSHPLRFIRSQAKHPRDGSKNSDVGHAWIYLYHEGDVLEGGHSGETGLIQPKYWEGVCRLKEAGDPNPVRYLWATQKDGFFQYGPGGHFPTFAARVDLTEKEYEAIVDYINHYPFEEYAITQNSCCSFVAGVARLVGLELPCEVTLTTPPWWSDPAFSAITFTSPDCLEASLQAAVREKKAQAALKWYSRRYKEAFWPRLQRTVEDLKRLPERTFRFLLCC